MKRNIILLLSALVPLFSFSQVAISLDGTGDYINTTINENPTNFANGAFTLECWVKSPNAPGTNQGFSGPVYGNFMGIYWNHQNSQLAGAGAVADQGGTFYAASFGQLLGNTWYHLALTYDGSILKSYKNGTLVNSVTTGGGLSYSPSNFLLLGRHVNLNYFFSGQMDEVRIWNIARSGAEINANYLNSIAAPETGLLASYTFEEGVPNGNNMSQGVAIDYSGNGFHGIFNSFNLNGTTSNYVGALSNLSGLQDAAINFDGASTSISTPLNLSAANFPGITLECWVKSPAAPGAGQYDGPVYANNMAIIWSHQSSNFRGSASIQAANGSFFSTTFGTLTANTWYHLALTYDGSVLKAYKNGVLASSIITTGGLFNNNTTLTLGRHPSLPYFFNGDVDAVRVWNTARTCYQINETINKELTSTMSGLQLSYNFNERYPEGQNSGINVPDGSGNGRDGTLSNFYLMGNSANYVYEAPFNSASTVPNFISQPQDISSCDGAPVTLQALVGLGGSFGFQWQVDNGGGFTNLTNSTDYSGALSMILTINNPTMAMNNYKYRCMVTSLSASCSGTTYSDTATLTVSASPTVNITGMGSVCPGASVTLTASGADAYSWDLPVLINDQAALSFEAEETIDITVTGTSNGCSSTATYTQNVYPSYNIQQSAFICQGQSYTFPDGTSGSATGFHTSAFTSINGCDSLIITNLTVQQPYTETRNVSICSGNSYLFPDMTFASGSGTNISVLTSMGGCDSTIITNLTVQPLYNSTVNASICLGQSYTFPDGTSGNTSQTQVSSLQSINGCDSIITTNLTVNSGFYLQRDLYVCHGETFTFADGTQYTANDFNPFVHSSVFSSINGCDSTYYDILYVNAESSSSETVSVCFGAQYIFPDGTVGTASGSHTSILNNMYGCDSLVFTFLTVEDPVLTNLSYSGNTLSINSSGSIQWFECGDINQNIIGATGNTFTPDHPGSYGALGANGSCSMVSECVTMNLNSLEETENTFFQLYPNPAGDEVHFINSTGKNVDIEIFSSLGQLVKSVESEKSQSLSIRDLPAGVYTFRINDGLKLHTKQLVKL